MFWKKEKTKIVVHFDAGFPNSLFLRGEGLPGMSWEKGLKMHNKGFNKWEIEFNESFKKGKFKVLINDQMFEEGENHDLKPGQLVDVYPRFLR